MAEARRSASRHAASFIVPADEPWWPPAVRTADPTGLLLHRQLIEKARDGLRAIEGAWDDPLGAWTAQFPDRPSAAEVSSTLKYVDGLAGLAKELKLLKDFAKIDQDILGAYFFRAPRPCIELYWLPIGLFSAAIGVSPEALTVVVATHELAHAYTHLGRDIDTHQWDTEVFARSDLELVEGLAQFYTRVICDHLAPRIPEAKKSPSRSSWPYKAPPTRRTRIGPRTNETPGRSCESR